MNEGRKGKAMNANSMFKLSGINAGFNGGVVQATDMTTGQRVSLSLTPSDVHDASEVPELLQSYKSPKFRADEICPVIPVDQLSDKFRIFNSDNAFQPIVVKTSNEGAIAEVDPESSLDTYTCYLRAIGCFTSAQTEMAAEFDVKARAAKRCADAIYRDIEIDVMTLLGTNTNWAASVRTAAATAWDQAGSTPIVDLQTAIRKSYQEVRCIVINLQTAFALINHDDTKDLMRQFKGDGPVTDALNQIAKSSATSIDFTIPTMPPFKVVNSQYVDATGTKVETLGKVAVLISGPESPMPDEIMSAASFRWRGPTGTGWSSREYTVEGRGPWGGTMQVVSEASAQKMIATTAGGIITNTAT
jgi:hypothetical protein